MNEWQRNALGVLAVFGCVVVYVLWSALRAIEGLRAETIRTNKYLRHLCWLRDQEHGRAGPDWKDPGVL